MPWFKVDDAFHSHPKAMKAGTAALGLWVRCGSWVAQQLTDGYVPVDVVRMYGTTNQAKALVAAGLWEQIEGGYQFHEWSPINPSRAEVEALREVKRKAGSVGGLASGRSRAEGKQKPSTDEAACFPSGSEVLNTHPNPSQPTPKEEGSDEPSRLTEPMRTDIERLCRRLADAIQQNTGRRPTITYRWRESARLLFDRDRRAVPEVIRVLDWCQRDDFWRGNILSLPKFREKYDQLRLQMDRKPGGQRGYDLAVGDEEWMR